MCKQIELGPNTTWLIIILAILVFGYFTDIDLFDIRDDKIKETVVIVEILNTSIVKGRASKVKVRNMQGIVSIGKIKDGYAVGDTVYITK